MSSEVTAQTGIVLRTVGLTKRFGRTVALDGLDLEVRAGEVHAFLGPNGAGKTTTIRILLGLRRRDFGDLGPSYGGGRLHDWLVDYLQLRDAA